MAFNLQLFKQHLQKAELVMLENEIKGSLTYLTYGLEVKQKLYSLAINLLRAEGFSEIKLTDIVLKSDIEKLDFIAPISKNYFSITGTDFSMAAGHEVPFYLFLKRYLKHTPSFISPMRLFHFGSVFRFPKNTKFPFNLGERRSFLENYIVYKDEQDSEKYLDQAICWNRNLIKEVLHIPSIEVERPLITNKPFSRKTVCIDSITPLGITVITGMSYWHDDIFTKIFEVKYKNQRTNKNILAHTIHFGVSDHLFFSYLLNSHDGRGFRLFNKLAPSQISIILDKNLGTACKETKAITSYLKRKNYSFTTNSIARKKLNTCIEKDIIKGIPLVITILHEKEYVDVSLRYRGDTSPQKINLHTLETIDLLLEKNDRDITDALKEKERDGIVDCTSLTQVSDVLTQGKVCKVYLQNNNTSVKSFESQILSGEILGFSSSEQEGPDILANNPVSTIAYISRRS